MLCELRVLYSIGHVHYLCSKSSALFNFAVILFYKFCHAHRCKIKPMCDEQGLICDLSVDLDVHPEKFLQVLASKYRLSFDPLINLMNCSFT